MVWYGMVWYGVVWVMYGRKGREGKGRGPDGAVGGLNA